MMNRGTMVFSLNTIVFGEEAATEEIPVVEADDAAEEAEVEADAVEEDVVEEETAAVASAETKVDATTTEEDGIKTTKNDKGEETVDTTITYALDSTNKKATVADVVTITNTTDPVSWNNAYAEDLLYTVLFGTDNEDEFLNNSSKAAVSENSKTAKVKGLRSEDVSSVRYEVIPLTSGESYILVGYKLNDGWLDYVEGYDTYVAGDGTGTNAWNAEIPIRYWDGRKVDFNKSTLHKATGSKVEDLDVKVSVVTYSSGTGTVTEVPGITVGGVKIDKKAIKAASVAAATTRVLRKGKYPSDKSGDCEYPLNEHAKLSDIPSFTISVKTKGTDASSYKKSVADKLKSEKFYFGIQQKEVKVGSRFISPEVCDLINDEESGSTLKVTDKDGKTTYNTPSANDIKVIEEAIAKSLQGGYTSNADRVDYSFSNEDFTISKFNGKKANLVLNVGTDNGKGKTGTATVALKAGKDYSFESGSLAGEDVSVLTFPTGGNYVYSADEGSYTYDDNDYQMYNISAFGYKYAFRVSPSDKKLFRYGVYAGSNSGFVYSAE